MFSAVINLLYPVFCQVCGKKSDSHDKNLCEECSKKIKRRLPPFCIKCGRQLPGEPGLQDTCNDCKKNPVYFDRAHSVFDYDNILKRLVHDIKYKKITSSVKELVDMVSDSMDMYDLGRKPDIVSCIPMHRFRLLKREINPSHILAKEVARKRGFYYSAKLLIKIKNTPPQSKLSRSSRIKNLKESFSVPKDKKAYVKGKNILLVDDLFTTGSTVNECARVLKEAGSNRVEVISLARGDGSI